MRNAYNILVWKPEGKNKPEEFWRRKENNTKTDLNVTK
jgi:hypothetical protein